MRFPSKRRATPSNRRAEVGGTVRSIANPTSAKHLEEVATESSRLSVFSISDSLLLSHWHVYMFFGHTGMSFNCGNESPISLCRSTTAMNGRNSSVKISATSGLRRFSSSSPGAAPAPAAEGGTRPGPRPGGSESFRAASRPKDAGSVGMTHGIRTATAQSPAGLSR